MVIKEREIVNNGSSKDNKHGSRWWMYRQVATFSRLFSSPLMDHLSFPYLLVAPWNILRRLRHAPQWITSLLSSALLGLPDSSVQFKSRLEQVSSYNWTSSIIIISNLFLFWSFEKFKYDFSITWNYSQIIERKKERMNEWSHLMSHWGQRPHRRGRVH